MPSNPTATPAGLPASAARAEAQAAVQVAVVGTGVVGLSAALGCAQRGLSVALVGPVPSVAASDDPSHWDARIYALAPATVGLLERQRVWHEVDPQRIAAVERMDVYGDAGGQLVFDALAVGVPRLATICEEAQLLRALWHGCRMAPNLRHVPQGFRAAAFAASAVAAGPPVTILLDNDTTLAAELLLGADGRQSAVRAAAGIGARVDSYGQTAIVANFACARPHDGVARQWFTDEGVVALLPLAGARVSLVWSAPQSVLPQLQVLGDADFAARVAQRCAHALGALTLLGPRQGFPLHRVVVDRVVRAGAVLLGDAAHVVHPLAGQGLNLGLQDVSEFLRLLDAREPWRALGDPVWLRRYERARAEPVQWMRAAVDGLSGLFGAPVPGVRPLRNAGMSLVNALTPLKHALVRHAMG